MNEVLQKLLQNALAITQSAQIPSHLEPAAFEKIVDILAATIPEIRPSAIAPANNLYQGEVLASEGSHTQSIATKIGLDRSIVEQVFSSDAAKGIEVIIGPNRLETTKKGATQQIAILVVGGRQLAGIEEWTSTKLIAEVCQHYGKFDSDNFARVIKELDAFFGFRGKGRMIEIKMNRPGIERLTSLINMLTEPAH